MATDYSDLRTLTTRFHTWVEGRLPDPSDPGLVDAVVRADATPEQVVSLGLRQDAILFAPEHLAEKMTPATRATVVGYAGELADNGAEIAIGDELLVQFESYSTIEYLTLVVPTCVTIVDEYDLDLLRTDVQRAMNEGTFPAHLLNPLVTFAGLAEILVWGPPATNEGGVRLTEAFRGELAGPAGLAARRYIAALRALQLASTRVDENMRVSGFGPTIVSEPARDVALAAPFVLQADDASYYVVEVRRNLFGRVDPVVAEIVDSVNSGRTPPRHTLNALGIVEWGSATAEALFDRLGLTLSRSGSASDQS